MENKRVDRIYVFLSSGLGHNKNPNKKYYFDKSDKVFFNLKFEDKIFKVWEKENESLSVHSKIELLSKIEKLESKSGDILEIKKLEKNFDLFPVPKNEDSEEFKKRAEIWRALFDEVDTFLNLQNIKIEETRLIE